MMFSNTMKRLGSTIEAHRRPIGSSEAARRGTDVPYLTPDLWLGNLLVCGHARSGATVALNHFAVRALADGVRVAMLSIKDEPSPWMREHCDAVVEVHDDDGRAMNREERYLDTLRSVRMGTQDDPLLLVLDDYPEASYWRGPSGRRDDGGSQIADEALRIARAEPWTCVAIRALRPSVSAISRELLDQLTNRLWTGRSREEDRLTMFNDPVNELAQQLEDDIAADLSRHRGAALWKPAGSSVRRVDVPWDPVVNCHRRRS